jgi:H/ACA ribonucleoprotein complex subunit 2
MAKEKSSKSDKKEKKEKRAEKNGVSKSKKDKSVVDTAALVQAVENESEDLQIVVGTTPSGTPVAALVPFANPLADEKTGKKVLKGVKKGMCHE